MGQPQVGKWVEAVNYSIHKLITRLRGPLDCEVWCRWQRLHQTHAFKRRNHFQTIILATKKEQQRTHTHTHSRQSPPAIEPVYTSTPRNWPATPIWKDRKREANTNYYVAIVLRASFASCTFRLALPSIAGNRNHRLTHLFINSYEPLNYMRLPSLFLSLCFTQIVLSFTQKCCADTVVRTRWKTAIHNGSMSTTCLSGICTHTTA